MKTDRLGSQVTKTVRAQITKVHDDSSGGPGGFEALVAVFGNLDSQGDIVMPGAFADSIKAQGDKPFPVLWAHQFYDETAIIGKATAEETPEGLVFRAEFLPMTRAQNIRKLMAEGLITEFSWSGKVTEGSWIDKEGEGLWGDGYYEIRTVDLWEAGPCFKGANPETELFEVKSFTERLTTKEGRVLAQKHVDILKAISEQLSDVITAVDKITEEEESEAEDEVSDEEKSETPPGDTDTQNEALEKSGAFSISKIKARLQLA